MFKWLVIFCFLIIGCSSEPQEELISNLGKHLKGTHRIIKIDSTNVCEKTYITFINNDFQHETIGLDKNKVRISYDSNTKLPVCKFKWVESDKTSNYEEEIVYIVCFFNREKKIDELYGDINNLEDWTQ